MPSPLCSVIVVSFNSGPALKQCVDSVLRATVPVQLLIGDNDSRDGSVHPVLRTWGNDPRVVVQKNTSNLGFAKACNRLLPEASGDWLLFLNPDCVLEPDTIARMVDTIGDRVDVGMAGCLLRNPDGSEQRGCRRREPTPARSLARVLKLPRMARAGSHDPGFDLAGAPLPSGPVAVDAISGAFMLVRRAALARVGLLDEGYFLHCEDLDWCRRFRDAGFTVLFVPEVEVLHLKGTSSARTPARVEWHKHRGMLRYYRKFYRAEHSSAMRVAVQAAIWGRLALVVASVTLRRLAGVTRA